MCMGSVCVWRYSFSSIFTVHTQLHICTRTYRTEQRFVYTVRLYVHTYLICICIHIYNIYKYILYGIQKENIWTFAIFWVLISWEKVFRLNVVCRKSIYLNLGFLSMKGSIRPHSSKRSFINYFRTEIDGFSARIYISNILYKLQIYILYQLHI